MESKALIISGFPGIGKTYFCDKIKENAPMMKVLDLDSSKFDIKHNLFEYLDTINKSSSKWDVVLISSHKSVRDALLQLGIKFVVIYPTSELKPKYIERYKSRNDNDAFVKLMEENFTKFSDEINNDDRLIDRRIKFDASYNTLLGLFSNFWSHKEHHLRSLVEKNYTNDSITDFKLKLLELSMKYEI